MHQMHTTTFLAQQQMFQHMSQWLLCQFGSSNWCMLNMRQPCCQLRFMCRWRLPQMPRSILLATSHWHQHLLMRFSLPPRFLPQHCQHDLSQVQHRKLSRMLHHHSMYQVQYRFLCPWRVLLLDMSSRLCTSNKQLHSSMRALQNWLQNLPSQCQYVYLVQYELANWRKWWLCAHSQQLPVHSVSQSSQHMLLMPRNLSHMLRWPSNQLPHMPHSWISTPKRQLMPPNVPLLRILRHTNYLMQILHQQVRLILHFLRLPSMLILLSRSVGKWQSVMHHVMHWHHLPVQWCVYWLSTVLQDVQFVNFLFVMPHQQLHFV